MQGHHRAPHTRSTRSPVYGDDIRSTMVKAGKNSRWKLGGVSGLFSQIQPMSGLLYISFSLDSTMIRMHMIAIILLFVVQIFAEPTPVVPNHPTKAKAHMEPRARCDHIAAANHQPYC